VLPAWTSGSHYSRHAWKHGSDRARDEEGLFPPPSCVLSVSLSLGTPEGQSPQARNVSLRHADCVFPRIGLVSSAMGEQATQRLGDVKNDILMFI